MLDKKTLAHLTNEFMKKPFPQFIMEKNRLREEKVINKLKETGTKHTSLLGIRLYKINNKNVFTFLKDAYECEGYWEGYGWYNRLPLSAIIRKITKEELVLMEHIILTAG